MPKKYAKECKLRLGKGKNTSIKFLVIMSQPAPTFDYLDENAWAGYFNNSLIPLAQSADFLWKCGREALSTFRGHAVTDFGNDEAIKQMLFGGVKSDRTLTERSLYKFYKSFMGLQYDYEKYVTEASLGVKPTDITIEVVYTPLLLFARWINEISKHILNKTGKELPAEETSAEIVLKDPELLLQEIKKLYERGVNFTAGYNPATFFVWSLRKNTRKHVNAMYDKLEAEEQFAKTRSFLGLTELFRPDMADPSKYIVFGFPEYGNNYLDYAVSSKLTNFSEQLIEEFSKQTKSLGGLICYLNELIWAYLKQANQKQADLFDTSMIIQNLPDARKEYFDRVTPTLNEKPLISVSSQSYNNFDGLFINRVAGRYSGAVPSLALTEALDSIAQHQFYGLIEYNVSIWGNNKSGSLAINPRGT